MKTKYMVGVFGLLILSIGGWSIGSRLSTDAIGMSVGIFFGLLAGIPLALMVFVTRRQADKFYTEQRFADDRYRPQQRFGRQQRRGQGSQIGPYGEMPYGPQPPVIIFAGNPTPHQLNQPNAAYGHGTQQPQGSHYYVVDQLPSDPAVMANTHAPPHNSSGRQFRVVGEQEEWVEQW